MRTATEVGGDYYDFHVDDEGTLTVAVGDATGHGTRAGIMVAAMKALFIRLCREPDMLVFFRECDRTFAGIGKNQIFMALCLLRIQGSQARVVGAAVPPLFVYRAATGEVEEVALRGMFLGTTFNLSFEEVSFPMATGDKILILSDGYLEQFDANSEELGYRRCTTFFKEAAGRSPVEIIDHLCRRLDEWRGEVPQGDDVTLVVLEANA